jgi:hypothetical protein
VQIQYRNIDVIHQFSMVLYRIAAGEEDNDLLFQILAQEGEQ